MGDTVGDNIHTDQGEIRKGRSVEESHLNVMEIQPVGQDVFDMDVAESKRYSGHHAGQSLGHRNAGGYHGGHRRAYGPQVWGRKRRSTEQDDAIIDLEAAEHHSQGYGSYGSYGNDGGYGNSNVYGNRGDGYNNYPSYAGYQSNNYGSYGGHNNLGR